jgi:predicted dehydrogenase
MNILVVGLGSIAFKHIDVIKKIDISANIYAIRSNPQSENIIGITNLFELESCDIKFDFAIISNPTHLHFKYIDFLMKKEVNLFIEKPPVSTLENIELLVNNLTEFKIINYVACNLRFHPCIQFLKNILDQNNKIINEVNIYCGSYLPDWRPNKNFREIYSSKHEMGGGVHLDLFHELDFTTWIFGFPLKNRSIFRNASSLKIDAFDYANYILEYESFTANIILNYYRKDPKRIVEVVFENETWTIDLIKNKIIDHNANILFENTCFIISDTYYYQMKYFINMLNSNIQPMNDLQESYKILKICLSNE